MLPSSLDALGCMSGRSSKLGPEQVSPAQGSAGPTSDVRLQNMLRTVPKRRSEAGGF